MTIEARARDILGLNDADQDAPHLSMRVENLWRAEGFAPVVPFNGAIFLPLGGKIDHGALRQALRTVLGRHEVLHSRLALKGTRPILVVDEFRVPELATVDVDRATIQAYREGGEPSPVSAFVETPLNLVEESGLRCRLFQDENGNIMLGVLLHHYFGDGWSSQILRREIGQAYSAFTGGGITEFAPPVQYRDYAMAQRQSLSRNLTAYLDYWHGKLETAPGHKLPYDHLHDTGQMGRMYFSVDPKVSMRLNEIARAQNVSLFAVYLSAFQLLLARWCGKNKAITAVNTADRVKPQFLGVVGYLIASLPVVTEMDDDALLSDLFVTVAKTFYDGYARRDLSYDLYDAVFQPPQPFCTSLFNFIPLQDKLSAVRGQQAAPPAGILTGPAIKRVRVHREIYFLLVEQPNGIVGKIYYNMDYFSAGTIQTLLFRFGTLLENMAGNPTGRLGDIG